MSVGLLFHWEWRLAAFATTSMAITMLIPRVASKRAVQAGMARNEQESRVHGAVQEALATREVIRAFNLWPRRAADFAELLRQFQKAAIRSYREGSLVSRAGGQGAYLVEIITMFAGGCLVIRGDLTMGVLVGFVALLQNMVAAISHLGASMPNLLQASASAQRVEEFLAAGRREESSRERGVELPRLARSLRVSGLSFGYDSDRLTLKELDFEVAAGTSVAIVGPSGSGKSTLLKLLLRFHEPNAGQMTWDGVDVGTASEASFRRQTSMVAQDNLLFDASVAENIRLGSPTATQQDVVSAAQAAEIHSWITEQPAGYETPVGELGQSLSGGQRQRVAIARAIIRDPALLLLDEATSALDPAAERAVCNTLEKVTQGRTVISATHRLNTISGYEKILVMQDGKLVQQGNHETLREQPGLYRELWEKQSGFQISSDGLRAACTPERLRLIPLLSSLDRTQLEKIAKHLTSEFHPAGRSLFHAGDPGDRFYILVQGSIEVIRAGRQAGDRENPRLESGDFFGELALIDGARRTATVKTRVPSLLLTLTQHRFRKLLEQSPDSRRLVEEEARRRRGSDAV